jgi:WhiB family redox-sensing transcriptional regulator
MKLKLDQGWFGLAACIRFPTDLFFPLPDEDPSAAVALCSRCLVRRSCFTHAMSRPELHGVWGGTTSEERMLLRRAAS